MWALAQPQRGRGQSWEAAAHPAQGSGGAEVQAAPLLEEGRGCETLLNAAKELQVVCACSCMHQSCHQTVGSFPNFKT